MLLVLFRPLRVHGVTAIKGGEPTGGLLGEGIYHFVLLGVGVCLLENDGQDAFCHIRSAQGVVSIYLGVNHILGVWNISRIGRFK